MKRNLLVFALCASATLPLALLLANRRSNASQHGDRVIRTQSGSLIVQSDPNWRCTFVYKDTRGSVTIMKDVSPDKPSTTPSNSERH